MTNIKTKIISAFPGCGKTYCFNHMQNQIEGGILDSDSSDFSWIKDENGNNTKERNPDFPNNYINHIKENMGKVGVIFVSSHDVVRKALEENNIQYAIIFPDKQLKDMWMERFRQRGNDDKFIKFISDNWDKFLDEIKAETYPFKIQLPYLDSYNICDLLFPQIDSK